MPNDYQLVRQQTKESQPENRSKIVIEPTPEQAAEQQANRAAEVQQRGGSLHDAIKIDPFSKSWAKKEFGGNKPITKT